MRRPTQLLRVGLATDRTPVRRPASAAHRSQDRGAVHPAADALIALAGPAGNLVAALLLVSAQQRTAALVFALLGVVSLLPWPARNDGAHALAAVRQHRIGTPPRSRR